MRRSWARCIITSLVPAFVVGVLLSGAAALHAATNPVLVATNAAYAVCIHFIQANITAKEAGAAAVHPHTARRGEPSRARRREPATRRVLAEG